MAIFNSPHPGQKQIRHTPCRSLSGGLAETFGNSLLSEAAPVLMAFPLPGKASRGLLQPEPASIMSGRVLTAPVKQPFPGWASRHNILQPVTARQGHHKC